MLHVWRNNMKWSLWVWSKKLKQNDHLQFKSARWVDFGILITVLAVPIIPWLRPALFATPYSFAQTSNYAKSNRTKLPTRLSSEAASTESEPEVEQKAKQESKQLGQGKEPEPKRSSLPMTVQLNTARSNKSTTKSVPACMVEPFIHSSQQIDRLFSDTGMAVAENLGTVLAAQLMARPFPEIHGIAKLARVPVIMYHDILPQKQVFFDVTPAEFEADLQLIQRKRLTPISLDQLVTHLSTGIPLPEKPILLSFDDGYQGHYNHVYPLLKQYGYPAVFGIYTNKVGKKMGRSSLSWAELREMATDPLVTIAAHSLSHPPDLRALSDRRLRNEVVESKRILETQLGISIKYFVYPEGKNDERVQQWVKWAGYRAALTMDDTADRFAGASDSLLNIERIGQGNLEAVLDQAYGGPSLPSPGNAFRFETAIELNKIKVGNVPLMLATGGRPVTIHAKSRYQVAKIIAGTNAIAAVDGGFFSLELLNSNVMVGPVLSQSTGKFVAGNVKEIRRIAGRPLVLISPAEVKYIPFNADKHNTLAGLQAELPNLTDAFVAAAWLVKDGKPQPTESFGNLFDFAAARDRAFWGIDQVGRAVVGVSGDFVDSVSLGKALSQSGLRDAVMLDSGASASLVFEGKSQMSYEPRPVPHVVALVPSTGLQLQAKCEKGGQQ